MNSLLAAKINNFMELYCNTWTFNGSILVAKNGETIIRKGLLDVNDKIANYCPELYKFDKRITIHHLLTHTYQNPSV